MNTLLRVLVVFLLSSSVLLTAQSEKKGNSPEKAAVYEMFEAQGMREQMDHIRNVMLQNQLKENPELMGYMYDLSKFYVEHAGYDAIKEDLAAIYLKYFTLQEIREITAFYCTPVGKKMRRVSAEILMEANELSVNKMKAGVPKFLKEMKKKGKLK